MKWEDFLGTYASHFRQLTDKDGLSNWKEFADSIKSPSTFTRACDRIAQRIANIKKDKPDANIGAPKLVELRMEFYDIIREDKEKYDNESRNTGCPYCHGSGMVECAVGVNQRILVPEQSSFLSDFKGLQMFPCPVCRERCYSTAESRENAKLGHRRENETNCFFNRFQDYDEWEYLQSQKQK